MKLNEIELKNFRNYEDLYLSFSKNINIFYGDNAEGKTNILESIYVLAITKSHRLNVDKQLITNEKVFSKIRGNINTFDKTKKLEILINQKGKSVKINDIVIKKISNYISNFNVIIFFPGDLDLIKGNPSIRRKFLNIEIGQIDNKYLSTLNEYNILIRTRNEYIKNKDYMDIDLKYISTLNDQLVKKSIEIYKKRNNFIQKINIIANNIYKSIFEEGNLLIQYKTNIDLKNFDDINIEKTFLDKLNNNLKRDVFLGITYYGPHRDDIYFYIDTKDIKEQASQGQQRIVTICLKLAEIEIFKEKTGEYPVLLLDDIFSELDETKKNNIIKYINKDIQTFISTTDLNNIDKKLLKGSKIYSIKKKQVVEIQ